MKLKKEQMKKIIISAFLVFLLNNLSAQRDVVKDNSSVVKTKTILSASDEIIDKYGKGSSISEYLIIRVREYEKTHNVKVVSRDEYDENLKVIKQLKNELSQVTDPSNRQNIGKKIAYIESKRVRYESIEAELLR